MQSEMWLNWALHITQLYNRCRNVHSVRDQQQSQLLQQQHQQQQQDGQSEAQVEDGEPKLSGKCKEEMHANVCSNMYPALLMSLKNIDFGFVLQVSDVCIAFSPGLLPPSLAVCRTDTHGAERLGSGLWSVQHGGTGCLEGTSAAAAQRGVHLIQPGDSAHAQHILCRR